MPDIRVTEKGVTVSVHVQPKASANAVAGVHDNALKIRLTAPPADNAANRMLVRFLSDALKIPASRLEIVAGNTSRKKKVLIRHPAGTDPDAAGRDMAGRVSALAGEARTADE